MSYIRKYFATRKGIEPNETELQMICKQFNIQTEKLPLSTPVLDHIGDGWSFGTDPDYDHFKLIIADDDGHMMTPKECGWTVAGGLVNNTFESDGLALILVVDDITKHTLAVVVS